jgi:hypothetical protein
MKRVIATSRCFLAVIALGTTAYAADQGCHQYSSYRQLPDTFREIANGDLSGMEFFIMSDGSCVCTSMLKGSHSKHAIHQKNKVWSCKPDTESGQPDTNSTP